MNRFVRPRMATLVFLFIIWRILTFSVAFFSPLFLQEFGASFPYYNEQLISSGLPHFIWSQGNFDGVHYLRIAQDGYAYQYTQVFFPLYPLLIKTVSFVTLGNFLIAALLISNVAFLVGLLLFYKLIERDYGKKIAFWSALFLLAFPTSFYFGAIYTEGLFFLMIISAFYFFNTKNIWLASIIGCFASATRLAGIFLALAMALRRDVRSLLPVLIVPLGFLAYVVFLKIKFNDPFYFLTAQQVFGQERSTTEVILLPQVFWRYLKILTTTQGLPFLNAFFEIMMTILALVSLIAAYKRVRLEWLVFSFLTVLTPTLTGTLTSMPRYILIAFPIFIVLASIRHLGIKILILFIFITLLAVSITFFAQGYWVA